MTDELEQKTNWHKTSSIVGIILSITMIVNAILILPLRSDIKRIDKDNTILKSDNVGEHFEFRKDIKTLSEIVARQDERIKNIENIENQKRFK